MTAEEAAGVASQLTRVERRQLDILATDQPFSPGDTSSLQRQGLVLGDRYGQTVCISMLGMLVWATTKDGNPKLIPGRRRGRRP